MNMRLLRSCSVVWLSAMSAAACTPLSAIAPSATVPAAAIASATPESTLTAAPTAYPSSIPTATLSPLGEIQPIGDGYVYLGDPKKVALGFNLRAGGAIGSLRFRGVEFIDDADFGRYIQFSPYDADDRYLCDASACFVTWGWNPLQAGSADGVPAKVQEYRRWSDGVYIRAPGTEWGRRKGTSDVVYETWAWDRGGYFEVHTRMSHLGTDTHGLAGAESPAAYFGAAIPVEYGYTGLAPFTAAEIQQYDMVTGDMSENSNPSIFPSESWMAFGDKQGNGLILAVPPQPKLRGDWSMVFIRNAYPDSIGYLAPFAYLETTPSSVFDLTYYLIPGPISQGRAIVYSLIPHTTWTFDLNSAEGWTGTDTRTEPENGVLTASLSSATALTSMPGLDFDGAQSPVVDLTARTKGDGTELCLGFVTLAEWNFDAAKSTCARVEPGPFQRVHLDFSSNAAWMNGAVTQLQLTTRAPTVLQIDGITIAREFYGWEFNLPRDAGTWVGINQMLPLQTGNGTLSSTSTGDDPYMLSPRLGVDGTEFSRIEIRMRTQAGSDAQVFFVTDKDPGWDEAKSQHFVTVSDGSFHSYTIDMSAIPGWAGEILQLRLDPMVTRGNFVVDYIRVLRP